MSASRRLCKGALHRTADHCGVAHCASYCFFRSTEPSPKCLHIGGGCQGTREDLVPRGLPRESVCHAACHAEIEGFRQALTNWGNEPNERFPNDSEKVGGVDGTRTRGLRRDRP